MSLNAVSNIFHRSSPDRARSNGFISNLSSEPYLYLNTEINIQKSRNTKEGICRKGQSDFMSMNPTVLLGR